MNRYILMVIIISCAVMNCSNKSIARLNDSKATLAGVQKVIDANNQLAFELYQHLNKKEQNLFLSPWSISAALTMTYEGARGQTEMEMRSTLHLPGDKDIRRPAFARIYNQINKTGKKYRLNTANALWIQHNLRLLPGYIKVIKQYYGGRTTNLNFAKETEKSRKTINSWVEKQTNKKIKNLISKGVLNRATKLVLTNAIYFKANWLLQFDKKDTRDKKFKLSSNKTIQTPMMKLSEKDFPYAEIAKLQILELPYAGKDLSMIVLLPKEGDITTVEKKLTVKNFFKWRKALRKTEVNVYLPKFTFKCKYNLNQALKKLGMQTSFSDAANFSGLTGNRDLTISDVIHQTFVKVNEEGTEAAGSTAVIMKPTSVRRTPLFMANHPFIFLIQQTKSGHILFIGKVENPKKEK